MSMELSLPNFRVETPSERRMYSYLYQTVQQLNWALNHLQIQETAVSVPVTAGKPGSQKSPAQTFAQIKDLIIKSADIVNAYCDTIRHQLDGLYVAGSEFGDYVEATRLELEANAKSIAQNFTSVQAVTDGLSGVQASLHSVSQAAKEASDTASDSRTRTEELLQQLTKVEEQLTETKAYVKTGLIATDEHGIPVYGLEIGQTNEVGGREQFNKYARFSSSRLSFYDQNDTEVAYISDYKLYITNVHITGQLTMGSYEIDTADGLSFRWTGGEA